MSGVWRWVPVIVVGGMVGTLTRALLEAALPAAPGGVPWTTLVINVVGSAALGALVQTLALSGEDRGARKALRLGAGTGLIGGFTTYSMFSLETVQLIGGGHAAVGLAYALGSVAAGLGAAALGISLASRLHTPRRGTGRPTGQEERP